MKQQANINPAPHWWETVLWVITAVLAFHLAYWSPALAPFAVVYVYALLRLADHPNGRLAFYPGMAIGFLTAMPLLFFFTVIFKTGAVVLWLIPGLWIGLFVILVRQMKQIWGARIGLLLAPVLWTGLEYFRCELYPLRFSWVNIGYAFAEGPWPAEWLRLGMYGIGFVVVALAVTLAFPTSRRRRLIGVGALAGLGLLASWLGTGSETTGRTLKVVGLQMEGPAEFELLAKLDKLAAAHPDADLVVLSEYTFFGPIPDRVHDWCRQHRKHLVVGGEDPIDETRYYNTAFVIGPDGQTVFRQVKSVPIQFFKDGLPAPEQKLWNSPWGKIGICICYDLSYTRVTDELVRQGAQLLVVPTMDVTEWGAREHRLHARVAPVRAAEYGIPIVRVCSSGISQLVDANGRVAAAASFPGQGEMLVGQVTMAKHSQRPVDRAIAPLAVLFTVLALASTAIPALMAWRRRKVSNPSQTRSLPIRL
jgi:apolipoprotein N-acyltransferase